MEVIDGSQYHVPSRQAIGNALQSMPELRQVHIQGQDYGITHPSFYGYRLQLPPPWSNPRHGSDHETGYAFIRHAVFNYLDFKLPNLTKVTLTIPSLLITMSRGYPGYKIDGR